MARFDFDKAVRKRDKAEQELERTIEKLVKEMHRLAGVVWVDPPEPELEKSIKGEG